MRFSSITASVLGLVCCAQGVAAQEDAPKKKVHPTRAQKIAKACEAMARLSSLAYSTSHKTTNRISPFVVRGAAKPKERTISTTGVWAKGLLKVDIGDDHQLIFHGRRMIAADDDNGWVLRRAKLANGNDLTFALDPSTLFANLADMDYKVLHNEVGTIGGKPVETYTIRLDEDDARTLLWSGSIPDDKGGNTTFGVGGGALVIRAFGGAIGGGAAKPDIFVDLAISFDPATKMIHRITGRSFTESKVGRVGGRIVLGGLGRGLEEEEEEEVKEGTYKNGLPVPSRSLVKKSTVVEFTFDFKNHNQAKTPKLSTRARALLGLNAK
jgi:hypothetical protein